MGSSINLECKKRVIRGTLAELKKYAKSKNIAEKRIRFDELGYYIKAMDRGKFYR